MNTTIECPLCEKEFEIEIDDADFDYSPEQKQINYPNERAQPYISSLVDYIGDDTATCPNCHQPVELDIEKLENQRREEVE